MSRQDEFLESLNREEAKAQIETQEAFAAARKRLGSRAAAAAAHAVDHGPLHIDPAFARYNQMSIDRYKHFRWTPRTAWITFAYAVAFPSLIGYFAYTTDGKYNFRGKRRGDIISEF